MDAQIPCVVAGAVDADEDHGGEQLNERAVTVISRIEAYLEDEQ